MILRSDLIHILTIPTLTTNTAPPKEEEEEKGE